MEIAEGAISIVATDSNRLSYVRAQTGQAHVEHSEYIVPKINLIELVRCMPMTDTKVEVYFGDNQLALHYEDTIFTTSLIEGRITSYRSVLYTDQESAFVI